MDCVNAFFSWLEPKSWTILVLSTWILIAATAVGAAIRRKLFQTQWFDISKEGTLYPLTWQDVRRILEIEPHWDDNGDGFMKNGRFVERYRFFDRKTTWWDALAVLSTFLCGLAVES